jgi:succinoglycan biosynthesis transport protein ExoP
MALAAVAGYFVNWWLLVKYPRFTSTALIEVHTPSELPPMGDETHVLIADAGPASLEVEQQTQASMLTNRYFLASILQDNNSPIRGTNWFRQWGSDHMDDAKQDLEKKLDVTPKPNTRLIAVSFAAGQSQDALTIVREIADRHIKSRTQKVVEIEVRKSQELSDLIDQYTTQLNLLNSQQETQRRTLAQFGTPDNTSGASSVSGLDSVLIAEIHEEGDAWKTYLEAKGQYEAFVTEINNNVTPSILNDYLSKGAISTMDQAVDSLEMQLTTLQTKYGPNNDNVRAVQKQLDEAKAKAEDRQGQRRQEAIQALKYDLQQKVTTAQIRYDDAHKKVLASEKDEQSKAGALIELARLKEREKRVEELLQKFEQQRRNLSLQIQSNGWSTANFFMEPDLPDSPSFPKLPITMTLAIALGLMLSLGIAFLREFTDTSVRSPRDIARVGQLNLLGMIPHEADDPESQGARLPLAIYEAPNSIIAEQFRQVRTRLQHSASLDTVRSLLVTGTSPGDGKTTVACNLAAGLALNGRRILLVDANFRRPQVHAVLNIPNETGFGDVLNSLDLFDSAVRETEIPNLSVLPTGVKPANSTELLESQLLIDFIERALEEYDHVIFDSGPLLLVSETAALAPRVDGVVTVVRARGNSRGMLQRLRDQLRQLKAENLGVILNAVRSQTGGYYAPMIKSYYAYQNT